MKEPSRSSIAPLALLLGFGVPLLIVLLALWQLRRMASWRFDPPFDVYDPALAAYDFSSILATLAPLSLLLGALSLLMFCVALIAIRRAAAKAMRSRDGLLDAFDSGRRWLPLFMVLQTLLIFGGMISLLSFEVLRGIAGGRQVPENTFKLLLIGGLIALLLLWYGLKVVWDTIRFARRQQELDPIIIMGQSLAPERAPLLWDFVREVAERGRAQLPDSVVVGLNEGFFVTEHPVVLANGQRVPEGRVLYLPLPYMAFMSREEVAAVIAHELGHFTGEDTSYGRRFTPIYRALVGSIFAISNEHDEDDDGWRAWVTAPATLYGKWFLQNFDEAVHHHSRVRELAADAFSARSVSADAAALALLRSAVLFEIIDEALAHNHAAPPGQREGVLPMVRRLVAERGLSDPLEHLDDSQPHPLDTHPPLKQRLDALGIVTTAELLALARDTGCVGLLTELGLEAKPAA